MSRDALEELEEFVKTGKFLIDDIFFEVTFVIDIWFQGHNYSGAGNTLESAILAALDAANKGDK